MPDSRGQEIALSRASLLKRFGVLGLAAAVPAAASTPAAAAAEEREALESLTATEAATLEAMMARLIPSDANGPGAKEARALRFVDRALASAQRHQLYLYSAGLAAVDAYAQARHGASFDALAPDRQDAVLTDMDANRATGFSPDSRTFFNLVRDHTIQGTFCDPYYGGNANGVGWKILGYPGIKLVVPARDQQLNTQLTKGKASTYDYDLFRPSKKKSSEKQPAKKDEGGQ
jgi:gluconate 2-dehydrogenase gamma chain